MNFDEVNAKKREGGWEGFEKAAEKKEEEEKVFGWKRKKKIPSEVFEKNVSRLFFGLLFQPNSLKEINTWLRRFFHSRKTTVRISCSSVFILTMWQGGRREQGGGRGREALTNLAAQKKKKMKEEKK